MKLNKTRQQMYLDGKVGLINDGTVDQLREVTNDRDYMGKFTYYHKNRIFPSNAPLDNRTHHPIAWFYENEMELPKRVRVDKANDGWYDTEIGNVFNVISEDDGKYFVEHPLNTEYLKHFIHKSDCTPINETELPKRVKYLGKVWDVVDYDMKLNKYGLALLDTSGTYVANVAECTPITEPTPTSYKLNIDLPNMGYKKGDIIKKREYTQIYYGNKKTEKMTRIHVDLLQYIATPIYTQPFTLENGTQIELTNNDIDKIKKM